MGKRLTSKLSWLALLIVIILVLTSCAAHVNQDNEEPVAEEPVVEEPIVEEPVEEEPAAEEPVEIELWSFWGSIYRRPIVEKMISDFNASQDRITAKYTFVPWGDIWTKNLAAIAAGTPPDVIVNDINTVAHRAKQNQNTNLASFIEQSDEDIQARFFPRLWDAMLYEEQPYALPYNTDTLLLYWNKDHFAEAGLDPERPPQTWAELEEFAEKLDKREGESFTRVGFYPLWGAGIDFWMLNSDGKNNIDAEGNVLINVPEHAQTMDWLISWKNRLGADNVYAFQAEFGGRLAHPFISQRVSMMVQNVNFFVQLRQYGGNINFGVTQIPAREEGSGHWSWGGGFALEIPYGAKNPDASFELIKYLTDFEAQSYWARWCVDIVANMEAASNPELHDMIVYKTGVENMEQTLLTPIPIFAPDFLSLVNPQYDAALLGNVSVQEALSAAQQDVENLIKTNR